jgi:hypothetical protein
MARTLVAETELPQYGKMDGGVVTLTTFDATNDHYFNANDGHKLVFAFCNAQRTFNVVGQPCDHQRSQDKSGVTNSGGGTDYEVIVVGPIIKNGYNNSDGTVDIDTTAQSFNDVGIGVVKFTPVPGRE